MLSDYRKPLPKHTSHGSVWVVGWRF